MAQAVFNEHPLEDYLIDAGDEPESMPGIIYDFTKEASCSRTWRFGTSGWLSGLVTKSIEIVCDFLSIPPPSARHSAFEEHFKYEVISSSLLSNSLPSPYRTSRARIPSIPGRLSTNHSRASSTASSITINEPHSLPVSAAAFRWPETLAIVVSITSFNSGHFLVTALTLGGLCYSMYINSKDEARIASTRTLDALHELITTGNAWDSVVHEAIMTLERDEQLSHFSSSPSIRVALHSSLRDTQIQCDNVRPLLAALAAPSELTQLTEMYGSPLHSPTRQASSVSLSPTRRRSFNKSKRSTWSGAYTTGISVGHASNKRSSKKPDMSAFLDVDASSVFSRKSSPTTSPNTGVEELDAGSNPSSPSASPSIGTALLDLQRSRRNRGLEALGFEPPHNGAPLLAPASRFTTVLQATRNPLHAALAARRYTCAHLLALRFGEEEARDGAEGYWEDVRSMMTLLAGALGDAAARLGDALDQAAAARAREGAPSPSTDGSSPERGGASTSQLRTVVKGVRHPLRLSLPISAGFAPMPSHLARFAAHVDAMSSALDDARGHLESCIAALKTGDGAHESLSLSSSPSSPSTPPQTERTLAQGEPALQAYERLRQELGLALRECERGRQKLLELVSPPADQTDGDLLEPQERDDPDNQHLEQEYATTATPTPRSYLNEHDRSGTLVEDHAEPGAKITEDDEDDASAHLLMTATSQHLPPPGAEQVFEAETESEVPFTRERSKLSREERVRIMKEKRQSAPSQPNVGLEVAASGWGPGGEVVQELKDVIWKVGERRRRLAAPQPLGIQAEAS